MSAGRTDRTNTIDVVSKPDGLIANPAGRGVWIGQDLINPSADPITGDVVVRLTRGSVTSANVVIPVSQGGVDPALAETTVEVSPENLVYTFPAGATFTNQVVGTFSVTVSGGGTPGAVTWELIAAPAGYSIRGTGSTREIVYSGARPTARAAFLIQANAAASDDATGGGASATISAGPVEPPQRTAATIATITRNNLDTFIQNITQLFSGSDISYLAISSDNTVSAVDVNASNQAAFTPAADGTTTITIIASNAGGTAEYSFDVVIDVLEQPTITWPDANYDSTNGRYVFALNPTSLQFDLGTLLPVVAVAGGAVLGPITFSVSSGLAGTLSWQSSGALSVLAGAAAAARTLDGQLTVSVGGTATARAASFSRNIRLEIRGGAAPVFSQSFYDWTLPFGTDPPPNFLLGTLAASRQQGETQRFRIISGNDDPQKLYAVIASSGQFFYTGPDAADEAGEDTLSVGAVNLRSDGSESTESTSQVRVTIPAAPAQPIRRNPAFAPVGGLTRSIQVGESFQIDFTDAFLGTGFQVSNTISDTDIISVTRSGLTFICTGLQVGNATYSVVATRGTETVSWVVTVNVHTAPPTATTIAWYRQTAANTFEVLTQLDLIVSEGAARADATSANPVYYTVTGGVNNRLASLTDIPAVSGLDITPGGTATINLPGGGTALGRLVRFFLDGSQFDYETQFRFGTVLQAVASGARISGADYAAATLRIPLNIAVQNVDEPPVATAAANARTIRQTLRIGGSAYLKNWSQDFSDPEGRTFTLIVAESGDADSSTLTSGSSVSMIVQPGSVVGTKTYIVRASDGTNTSTDFYTLIVTTEQREPSKVTIAWQRPTALVSPVSLLETAGTGSPVFSNMYATASAADADVSLPAVRYVLSELQVKTDHDVEFPFKQIESLATETLILDDAFVAPSGVDWTLGVSSSDATALAVSGVFAKQALLTAGNLSANRKVRLVATASVGGRIVAGRVIYREVLANKPLEINPAVVFTDIELTYGSQSVTVDLSNAFLDPNGEAWTLSVQSENTAFVNPVNLGNKRYRFDYAATGTTSRTTLITIGGTQGTRTLTRTYRVTLRPPAPAGTASIAAKAVSGLVAEAVEDDKGNSLELAINPTGEGTSAAPIRLRGTRADGVVSDVHMVFDPGMFFAAVGGDPEIIGISINTSPAPTVFTADIGSGSRAFHLVMTIAAATISGNLTTDLDLTLTARNSADHSLTATSILLFRGSA